MTALAVSQLKHQLRMDATEKLVEKLVERRMQNTGESQAVATAKVMAAFEKLKKKDEPGSVA